MASLIKAPLKRSARILRLIIILLAGIATILVLPGSFLGRSFQAAAASDPVIGAAGDIACDPSNSSFNGGNGNSTACRQLYTSNLLVNSGLTAVLDLGDNQYYSNAAGYFQYFGSAAGKPGQGWYSFNIGTWHLIALNSNCGNVGGCGSGSPQYTFLKSDLAAHPNQCILAFWHIPLFSSGGRAASNSQPFWSLLYAAHADVVLNGHDHVYERFAQQNPSAGADPKGVREFIVGTGGSDHTTFVTTAANSQVRDSTTYGILKLTLHPGSYDWKFVPEAGKTFTDSGTTACHSPAPATPTPTATRTLTLTGTRLTGTPTRTPTQTSTRTGSVTPTGTSTLASTPATGTSFTFRPAADAYVDSSQPTTNFGTSTSLRVDGSPTVNSYLRFNVSGLSGTITRVRLLVFANSAGSLGIKASKVADTTWGETTITYNTAPAIGSALNTSAAFGAGTWVTIDVSGYVTGNGTYSFVITDPSATAVSLAARESGTNAEQLIVDTK